MDMNPIRSEDMHEETKAETCSTEGKDCGCSNGLCPGMILGGVILAAWGIYALGSWIWSVITG
ncbi:MAG: hypothetical protein Fur0032_15910 [Terrimicrobiaceae bacterium]